MNLQPQIVTISKRSQKLQETKNVQLYIRSCKIEKNFKTKMLFIRIWLSYGWIRGNERLKCHNYFRSAPFLSHSEVSAFEKTKQKMFLKTFFRTVQLVEKYFYNLSIQKLNTGVICAFYPINTLSETKHKDLSFFLRSQKYTSINLNLLTKTYTS